MAIEIDSDYSDAYYNRAIVKEILKDTTGAFKDYTKALEIDPKYTDALYNGGVLKILSGQKEKGCRDLVKADEIGHTRAMKAVGKLCD